MVRVFGGPALEGGQNLLTLWRDDHHVAGIIGVIATVAVEKAEMFLAHVYVEAGRAEEVLPELFRRAYEVGRHAPGVSEETVVRLGVRAGLTELQPVLERVGFHFTYRALELARGLYVEEGDGEQATAIRFVPLDANHVEDFLRVHNPAFLRSPNGGPASSDEVKDMLATASSPDFLQVGYVGSVPVAALELGLEDRVGQVGTLAVAPEFQGRGLGTAALHHALKVLRGHGAAEVRLTVVEANTAAVRLYRRHGFTLRSVVSTWFAGPPLVGS